MSTNTVPKTIIKCLDTLGILVWHYSVINNNRREINDLLKDRIHACSIRVNSDPKEIVSTNTT